MNIDVSQVLLGMSLFRDFTESEVTALLHLTDPLQIPADECIVRQDEVGDCMYVIIEGEARVVHHKEGKRFDLAVLKAGDFFGELALVDEGPRSADVESLTPCTLLRIPQSVIRALAGVYPNAAFKFLISVGRVLVSRMRASNRRYIDSLLLASGGKD
jgi:CRP-like cAMP-binding protein